MIFSVHTSRKLLSSLIGPSVSVGGLYFVTSSSSISPNSSDDRLSASRGTMNSAQWWYIPRFLDWSFIRIDPYHIDSTQCDHASTYPGTNRSSDENGQDRSTPVVAIRKRMTSIGHFSLKSETPQNLSIPTFFIALAGPKRSSVEIPANEKSAKQEDFTISELESVWTLRDMSNLHPRFHSKVCPDDDGYFIRHIMHTDRGAIGSSPSPLITTRILHDYAKETIHPQSYRIDLQKRIEHLLTHPMDVSNHLWEVYISNGRLGSSGAISKKKATEYATASTESRNNLEEQSNPTKDGIGIRHAWAPLTNEPRESLLLFRAHHSIADGASLVAAFGDLVDEADEIRLYLKDEMRKRFEKAKNHRLLETIFKYLINCFRFMLGAITALTRQLYLMVITWNRNPFLRALNVRTWDDARASVLLHDEDDGASSSSTRTVSWCEIATVDQVKTLAKTIGSSVTVNDVFVSCVTRAIAHQLTEHRQRVHACNTSDLGDGSKFSSDRERYINVVIPVHLFGGINIPGAGMGNRIGAVVARVICEDEQETRKCKYSAINHLESVHSSLQAVKTTPAHIISFIMAKVATTCLPSSWVSYLFRQMNANAAVVITNTRGFPRKVHINGRSVEAVAGFFPLPPCIPVGVVIQSYNDVVSVSVTAEKWAVPDADRFLGWILDEYKNLLSETTEVKGHQLTN